MTWMTPLVVTMFALVTFDSFTFTPAVALTFKDLPASAVLTEAPSFRSAGPAQPLTT